MPAPKFAPFSDPNLAYIWALRIDSHGRLYARGRSDAKVLRFDDPAKPTTVFESPSWPRRRSRSTRRTICTSALRPTAKFKSDAGRTEVRVLRSEDEIHLGARDGFAGNPFRRHRRQGRRFSWLRPTAKAQLFYQSDERHARSLAFDAKGNLLVGTEPDGLILRVEVARKECAGAADSGHVRSWSTRQTRRR